jgi:hypothetical protein
MVVRIPYALGWLRLTHKAVSSHTETAFGVKRLVPHGKYKDLHFRVFLAETANQVQASPIHYAYVQQNYVRGISRYRLKSFFPAVCFAAVRPPLNCKHVCKPFAEQGLAVYDKGCRFPWFGLHLAPPANCIALYRAKQVIKKSVVMSK